jgi:hypothetical protein
MNVALAQEDRHATTFHKLKKLFTVTKSIFCDNRLGVFSSHKNEVLKKLVKVSMHVCKSLSSIFQLHR